ncbi:acyl-CoA--6-aminopenicillanic acid acyltransferase [Leptospira perolatii]|uniref:Acyl-CoA--6-aminopenicillanic acid acyltransferase n=2 Tax=Leptospira perolatii TaxID=2023191 RepID=A0A2M9ZQY3_9LEPT|nr:acyl-CoA--6-aminopenicillanic acid acyltransferase [Leptospira perolatii]PJZ74472.1 acyl-CoA--6-aminopenicillanic acid acyltransferase [Leptospira perolatii]
MGRQFGEIMNSIGEFEPIFDFYPVMARNLLVGSLPRSMRGSLSKGATSILINWMLRRMSKHRSPEFSARTIAALTTAGKSSKIAKELFTMDAFQNSVGLLGLIQFLPEIAFFTPGRTAQMVPACSSVAVWGDQSKDGKLYHARNFDFPGVDVWDTRPIVAFCTPDQGLRYGYIACRGADVPGITAFNEAGITIAFHTRFHKKVGFSGVGVIDLGHEIISKATNIREAVEIARRRKINSTWGMIITSQNETGSKAAVIETNYGDVDVTYSTPGSDHIVNTNHYFSPRLQQGEILASPVFYHHSLSRYQRAQEILASQRKKGTTVSDLQNLLNDTIDPSSGGNRTMGSTLRQITSVKSVVMSPEAGKLSISVGVAPTGGGPYVEVPIAWGKPGYKIIDLKKQKSTTKNSNRKAKSAPNAEKTAVHHYKQAMLIDENPKLGGIDEIIAELDKAAKFEAKDPSILFLKAMLYIEKGKLKEASELMERVDELENSSFRKLQNQLWLARTNSVLGKNNISKHYYEQVKKGKNSPLSSVWIQKAYSDKGKYSPRKLKLVSPNFLLVDVNEI